MGKAQEIYAAMSLDWSSDYEMVKAAVLNAYELVPEAYWQKFRESRTNSNQMHVEFARDKKRGYLTDGVHPCVLTRISRSLGS